MTLFKVRIIQDFALSLIVSSFLFLQEEGSNFTMGHISEFTFDHRLVGRKGLRLKVCTMILSTSFYIKFRILYNKMKRQKKNLLHSKNPISPRNENSDLLVRINF